MSFSDDLESLLQPVENPIEPPAQRVRSADWQAGVQWRGEEGTITTGLMDGEVAPDWSAVLRIWGLDPEAFDVVEPILFNVWGDPDGVMNRQWKGKVVRKFAHSDRADLEVLIRDARKMRRSAPPVVVDSGAWLTVVVADWQTGKKDGDGLEGLVDRWLSAIGAVEKRWKELRKIGRPLEGILVLCVGDLVEGCDGHYAMQTFSVELDRRDQKKVARRLLKEALVAWSKFAPAIKVAAVGGNHGENRKKGKAFTTFNDNDDVALVEEVAEILAANPEAFGHVEFAVPRDALTLTVEVAGRIVGITHGHLAGGGQTVEAKLRGWMANQALGKQPIADCDILVTGHYHHFRMADWGGVVWLQAPSLEGGSDWWRQLSGQTSQRGVLSFTVTAEGVGDIQLI
jgi:predicted phosphodiesterase